MRTKLLFPTLAALLLGACVLVPTDDRGGYVVAPPLPAIVQLDVEPFFFYGGYHYFYDNNRWRYSNSRSGPWVDLPRSHYPRETRFRGRPDDRRGDPDRDRRGDSDRDRRGDPGRDRRDGR